MDSLALQQLVSFVFLFFDGLKINEFGGNSNELCMKEFTDLLLFNYYFWNISTLHTSKIVMSSSLSINESYDVRIFAIADPRLKKKLEKS